MRPPLAVCIPTYARAGLLARLLAHLADEAPDVPVLVADNASPDDTPTVLRDAARPELRVQRQPENLGPLANIHWLLAHAPDAEHVWLVCDDDLPVPGSVAAVRDFVAAEHPAWLHLPHRWVDGAGRITNQSPCPATLERYPGTGALYRAYGHWLTFGSAAILRRDALAHAAATVATTSAYAPLVWFASAAGAGPCAVAPFYGVHAGTEITWAEREDRVYTVDYPGLFEEVLHRHVDAVAFGTSLDQLFGSEWGLARWRGAPLAHVGSVLGRFPTSRAIRRIAVERAAPAGDGELLARVRAAVGEEERAAARAARSAGEGAFAAGDHLRALALLEGAAYADPLDAETWNDLGVVRHALGRRHPAIAALDVAVALAPSYEDACVNRLVISQAA